MNRAELKQMQRHMVGRVRLTGPTEYTVGERGTFDTRLDAWNWCRDNLDMAGHRVTVWCPSDNAACTLQGQMVGQVNVEDFEFRGIGGPLGCIMDGAGRGTPFFGREEARFAVTDMTLRGYGIMCAGGTVKAGNVWFGMMATGVNIAGPRSTFATIGKLTFLNEMFRTAFTAEDNAMLAVSHRIVMSGKPSFSKAFAQATLGAVIDFSGAESEGQAVGKPYAVHSGGMILGGCCHLPGDEPGEWGQHGIFQP